MAGVTLFRKTGESSQKKKKRKKKNKENKGKYCAAALCNIALNNALKGYNIFFPTFFLIVDNIL